MASYSQRYQSYQRYFTQLSEDILSYTICLPFTLGLVWTFFITEAISELVSDDNKIDQWFWTPSKFILLMPITMLKGLLQISVIPLLAFCAAFFGQAPRYPFYLTQIFEKNQFKYKFAIYALLIWFNPMLALALIPIVGYLTYAIYYQFKHNKELDNTRLGIIALMPFLIIYDALIVKMAFDFTVLPLLISLSLPMMMVLGPIAIAGWLIAKSPIDVWLAKTLDFIIVSAQKALVKIKVNPFKNDKDISLTDIKEVSSDDLFVSNSNHAFNLNDLQRNVSNQGLKNYYVTDKNESLDQDDVIRLENHHHINKFPTLKQFIVTYKQTKSDRVISQKTLNELESLANQLMKAQENDPAFPENLLKTKESFDAYMQTIPPTEQEAVKKLNLMGGTDPYYEFETLMNKVYNRTGCKKEAGRLILNSNDRLKEDGDKTYFQPFWQTRRPRALW